MLVEDCGVNCLPYDVYSALTWPQRETGGVERPCCLVVDNMSKIVEVPTAIIQITPKLEPLVKATCGKLCSGTSNKVLEPLFPFVVIAAQTISNAIVFVKKLAVYVF